MIHAIVAFYSPSGYRLPREYLASTLAWLSAAKVQTTLTQVVRPGGEPQPVMDYQRTIVYESTQSVFWKENLWNLAAAQTDADKLLFLDADVRFSRDDVAALASAGLDYCDVMQPFETAMWFDRSGDLTLARKSAAYGLLAGQEPTPGRFHPGFAWAMTRSAFDAIGGFSTAHPFGGGDVAFAYSLDGRWLHNNRRQWLPEDTICWDSPSYIAYQQRAVAARLRLGYCAGVEVYHRWHGEVENRQYTTRCRYVPISRGQEYPLRDRGDGLLEWSDPAAAEASQRYFDSRREDG